MIKCPVCQAEHPENTLFCDECGSFLQGGDQKETDPLGAAEVTWVEIEEAIEVPGEKVISPLSLKLTISDSGREVELPLKKEVNIGRLDPTSDCFPEIDLTSDSGLEKGVSRRHAKITSRGSEVFIEDLGSINGTFLNRKKLTPYLPHPLKSGDELQLGKLIIRVELSGRDLEVIPKERELYIQSSIDRLFALQEEELYYLEYTPGGRKSLSRFGATTIGRSSGDIRIPDSKVSREDHCRISGEAYQFFIEDLDSTNGTFLNEVELSPRTKRPLHHGDAIRVGTTVLSFHDQLAAFLAELSIAHEKEIAIRSIKMNHEQNRQVALQMLAKLMETAMKDPHDTIGEVALAIRDVTAKQPLEGISLLLQMTQPGEKYVHSQVYRTLGDLMSQDEGKLLESLETLAQRASEYSPTLLYWISREMEEVPFKSFLEACVGLFSHGGYIETDLERLIEILGCSFKGVEAKDLLLLYQTFLDLLRIKTLSQISVFRPPYLSGQDYIPLINTMHVLEQLAEISMLTQKSALVEDAGDKLYYLTEAQTAVDKIRGEIPARLREPESAICSEILSRWQGVISTERKRLRGRAELQVELLTRQAFPKEQITLALKLLNTGQAFAENVRVTLETLDDYEIIEAHSRNLVGISAKHSAQVEFTVHPKRDDRMRVEASVIWDDPERKQRTRQFADTISFKVKREFTHIPNPYVAGNPITSPKLFFGREDVFDFVLENLVGAEQKNTLVLHGQRRTGKSSVLLQLRDRVLPQEFIPIYINMEALPDVKTMKAFLARLAYEIGSAARKQGLELEVPTGFGQQPATTFDRFMDAAEDALSGQRFVIMFDEFELIESKIAQGMDASVLNYFRNLMQHRDSLIFVFTGTHRLQEMTHDYWSILFSIALNREISFLDEEDTRRLITEPVQDHLEYDDLTIEKIIRVTHCQPYLVQLICWQLVNYLNGQKRNYAIINDLNRVLDQTLVTAEAYFSSIWEQSTSHQRLALALLTILVYPGKETAALSEVEKGLADQGVNITGHELIAALNELCHRDVLEERTNGELRYRFQIDLVRMWVEKNKPLSRVLIEEGL